VEGSLRAGTSHNSTVSTVDGRCNITRSADNVVNKHLNSFWSDRSCESIQAYKEDGEAERMSYSFNQFVEDLKRRASTVGVGYISENYVKQLLRQLLNDHPEEAEREIVDMKRGIVIKIGDLEKKKLTSKEWIAFLESIMLL
jgi:hypothetical protein